MIEILTVLGALVGSSAASATVIVAFRSYLRQSAEEIENRHHKYLNQPSAVRNYYRSGKPDEAPTYDAGIQSTLSRANRLSICGKIGAGAIKGYGCGRYSRDYQQKLAWLVDDLEKTKGQHVNLSSFNHEQICPHCKTAASLKDSSDSYSWLNYHPDCPVVDAEGYKELKRAEARLKETIKEIKEIEAFVEYNKLREQQTGTVAMDPPVMPPEAEELADFLHKLFSQFGVDLESVYRVVEPEASKEVVDNRLDKWDKLEAWDAELLKKVMGDDKYG